MSKSAGTAIEQIGYKAIAFLKVLTMDDVDAMVPARRRQLVDLCAHWAKRAEPKAGRCKLLPEALQPPPDRPAARPAAHTPDPSVIVPEDGAGRHGPYGPAPGGQVGATAPKAPPRTTGILSDLKDGARVD